MNAEKSRRNSFSGGIGLFVLSILSPGGFAEPAMEYDEDTEECSTIIAVGTATVDGKKRTGHNGDSFVWKTGIGPTRVLTITINEKSRIKSIAGLNSCGVAREGNGRSYLPGMV